MLGGLYATIYDWFGYSIPIKQRYELIKKAGFDGILMWWSSYLERGDYRKGSEYARETSLFIENIHTPFQVQDDIWSDNLAGEASIDCYMQCVSDCSEFDIPTMVIHLPDDDKPHNLLGLNRIKRLAEKAEMHGVNISFENLNNYENLTYILDNIDSKRVGFCYDVCHHLRYYPQIDLPLIYGSRMTALHLHDYDGISIHKLPFDGITDWQPIMDKLAQINYNGDIAIEAMNWSYTELTAIDFLYRAYDSTIRLAGLIL